MSQVIAIALNTFRETVRDKVLYGILFFAIVFILLTLVLGELSLHQEKRIIVDLGLAGISIMSVLLAIILGVGMLYKEIDRKTLYPILSKPVSRWQFVLGKYLGMNLTLSFQIILMTVVMAAVLHYKGGEMSAPVVFSLYLIFIEILVITSIALLFSSFSTPFISGILTLGVFVVGRNVDLLETFIRKGKVGPLGEMLSFVPHIFPNCYLFYPSGRAIGEQWVSVHQHFIEMNYLLKVSGYGLLYAMVCLLLAMIIFNRKDLI
ncbi:MAG: ABC transporter permease subunit [Pseudomonadota bacterium]